MASYLMRWSACGL